MRASIAGFALGIIILQQQASLPGWIVLSLLASGAILCLTASFRQKLTADRAALRQILRFTSGILFGFFWASLFALSYLSDDLPEYLEGKNIVVTGTVASLPGETGQGKRFEFAVEHAELAGSRVTVPPKIGLSWSNAFQQADASPIPDIRPGSRWRLNVRLMRPHGNANPDGFDYEAWLLKQNIRATGYVRQDNRLDIPNREFEPFTSTPRNVVNRARNHLRDHILQALPDARYAGIILALVIGDQNGIGVSEWDIFSRTGISHLVAISGLHITLISGMFAALVSFLWRRSFFTRMQLPLVLPAQKAAAVASVLMAWVYVLLAGFGLPAQRTLCMIVIVAVALWMGRITRVSHTLFAALGIVLLFDPWAVLAPGFWLSFGAVGIILIISAGRKTHFSKDTPRKTRWLHALQSATRIQLAIMLGLIPLTLLFFGRISLISPIANAIAIPAIGSVVTPMALFGSILPSFPARYVLGMAHYLVNVLVLVLEWLSSFPFAIWAMPVPSAWFFLVATAGTIWMLAPKGWPVRWMGAACWLPVFMAQPFHPPGGEAIATALDVGQGSAVLIETSHHRLLYDTGPAYTGQTNAASRIIIPYLNARGISSLDALVISHGDMDHAGGAASILANPDIPVGTVYSPLKPDELLVALAKRHHTCLAGQAWEWDGVRFEMLGPTAMAHLAPESRDQANALSCVLKVTAGSQSMLLPGDIGVKEEAELLERIPEKLKSDILLAPHHGSNTSSSLPFLAVVKPSVTVFQLGYRNRYGHPDDTVYARYDVLGITRIRTDEAGAVTVRFGKTIGESRWREEHARYWYGR